MMAEVPYFRHRTLMLTISCVPLPYFAELSSLLCDLCGRCVSEMMCDAPLDACACEQGVFFISSEHVMHAVSTDSHHFNQHNPRYLDVRPDQGSGEARWGQDGSSGSGGQAAGTGPE